MSEHTIRRVSHGIKSAEKKRFQQRKWRRTYRLRIRSETLSGTWETLVSGQADLAIGCVVEVTQSRGILNRPMGQLAFVYAVAPHHPGHGR